MKVEDVMTKNVYFCNPGTNVAQAAEMMWTDAAAERFPVTKVGM